MLSLQVVFKLKLSGLPFGFFYDKICFIIQRYCFREYDPKKLTKEFISELFVKKFDGDFHKDHVRYVDKPNSELVCISYTSGTTGFSKGVMLTGNNYAGNITFGIRTKLLRPGYSVVAFLPLAHAYGCAFDFLTATCTGSHVYFFCSIMSR